MVLEQIANLSVVQTASGFKSQSFHQYKEKKMEASDYWKWIRDNVQ
jgi:hypothetical protein